MQYYIVGAEIFHMQGQQRSPPKLGFLTRKIESPIKLSRKGGQCMCGTRLMEFWKWITKIDANSCQQSNSYRCILEKNYETNLCLVFALTFLPMVLLSARPYRKLTNRTSKMNTIFQNLVEKNLCNDGFEFSGEKCRWF